MTPLRLSYSGATHNQIPTSAPLPPCSPPDESMDPESTTGESPVVDSGSGRSSSPSEEDDGPSSSPLTTGSSPLTLTGSCSAT